MEVGTAASKKVMVVADPTRESAVALQWALSHAVVDHDVLILLHVENGLSWRSSLSTFLKRSGSQVATIASRSTSFSVSPLSSPSLSSSSSSSSSSFSSAEGVGDTDFLETMKRACEAVQPKARVRVERVDVGSQDKAATILFQSAALSVDLLVIGQRRSLSTVILGPKRSVGSSGSMKGTRGIDTAEFLIENSVCTCVGVQKKGQNGGYVLNTKTQKNFWLLA